MNYWRLSPSQWFWDWGQGYGGSNAYTHQHDRGHCCAEDALTMYLGQGSSEWTDYRYSVRFRAQEGRQAGIWFRGTYKDVETKGRGRRATISQRSSCQERKTRQGFGS